MLSGFFLVRQEMLGTFFFKPLSELRELRIPQILILQMFCLPRKYLLKS